MTSSPVVRLRRLRISYLVSTGISLAKTGDSAHVEIPNGNFLPENSSDNRPNAFFLCIINYHNWRWPQ